MSEATQEELKKCGSCKKAVNRAKLYYRNGKNYCNMNCWTKAKKEAAKAAAEAAAEAAGGEEAAS